MSLYGGIVERGENRWTLWGACIGVGMPESFIISRYRIVSNNIILRNDLSRIFQIRGVETGYVIFRIILSSIIY